ncbi:MAG TPA: hypothetical protein VMU81_27275 [Acetobacteraceae bacterium]|jgi:hypothetical protein|nr:hypothetical protein [Acetobacteraceae bacterium]
MVEMILTAEQYGRAKPGLRYAADQLKQAGDEADIFFEQSLSPVFQALQSQATGNFAEIGISRNDGSGPQPTRYSSPRAVQAPSIDENTLRILTEQLISIAKALQQEKDVIRSFKSNCEPWITVAFQKKYRLNAPKVRKALANFILMVELEGFEGGDTGHTTIGASHLANSNAMGTFFEGGTRTLNVLPLPGKK